MSKGNQVTHDPSTDFDAAKSVVDKLASLPRDRQERILRWVSESLGISLASPAPPTSPALTGGLPGVAPPAAVAPPGGAKDIKTFIAEKAPKSDNQFATAVAYYYRFEASPASRRDTIDGAVLQEAARLAGWRRPKRPTDTLHNALKAGYLDGAERGTFRLNNVGENLVAMAMPGGSSSGPNRKGRKRKRAASKKAKSGKRGATKRAKSKGR